MALLDAFRNRRWLRTATSDPTTGSESKAFLDKVGLATLWAKIKSTFATKAEVEAKADQATTLAGYGITDAKIESGVITLGSNTITPLTSHQKLNYVLNYYSSRPKSANIQFGDGNLRHFKATSSMTTGKPAVDAHILHFAWDANNGYDAQLAVPSSSKAATNAVYWRTQTGGTWNSWRTILDADNYSNILGSVYQPKGNYLTSHQDISGKADKSTTLSGYGITDAKIADGTITLGANSITPITSHQSLSNYATKTELNKKADAVTWQELTAEEVQVNGLTLDPYTHYVIPDFDSDYFEMHINSFPDRTSENFLKPCFVQFYVGSGLDFSLTYPTGMYWANGELPTFEDDTWYQLSIVGGCAVCTKFATV